MRTGFLRVARSRSSPEGTFLERSLRTTFLESPDHCIPYIPGLSERVARVFRRAGGAVSYKPPPTLRSFLVRKKPPGLGEPRGLVYRVPCGQCEWSYVGETGRTLGERLAEHKRAVRQWSTSSEIAKHVMEEGHSVDWEAASIVAREGCYRKRIFKEAWFTKVHRSSNRVFTQVDETWDRLF